MTLEIKEETYGLYSYQLLKVKLLEDGEILNIGKKKKYYKYYANTQELNVGGVYCIGGAHYKVLDKKEL